MARYDRIARLPAPPRTAVFGAWPALLDCETAANVDAARRARARFLALRPLTRLIRHPTAPDRASLLRQIAVAEAEIARWPEPDPERRVLARFLAAIEDGLPRGILAAARDVAAHLVDTGAPSAAEEFALCARELAEKDCAPPKVRHQSQNGGFALSSGTLPQNSE